MKTLRLLMLVSVVFVVSSFKTAEAGKTESTVSINPNEFLIGTVDIPVYPDGLLVPIKIYGETLPWTTNTVITRAEHANLGTPMDAYGTVDMTTSPRSVDAWVDIPWGYGWYNYIGPTY